MSEQRPPESAPGSSAESAPESSAESPGSGELGAAPEPTAEATISAEQPGAADVSVPRVEGGAEQTAPIAIEPTEAGVEAGVASEAGAVELDLGEAAMLEPTAAVDPALADVGAGAAEDQALPDEPVGDPELREALGVGPATALHTSGGYDPHEGDDEPRTSRRLPLLLAVLGSATLITALVLLGHRNAERYLLTCETAQVIAQRGRSFPPWGVSPLDGAEWKPVPIPLVAECRDREAGSEDELIDWYLALLIDQATTRLTARKIVDVDVASAQLEQSLLFARSPQRREQRREIERLLGDVEYWRAVDQLRTASEAMAEAAKQFEEAAVKQPRHVGDAAARAVLIRRLLQELGGQAAALQHASQDAGEKSPSPLQPLEPPPQPTLPLPSAPAAPDAVAPPLASPSAAEPVDAGVPADAAPPVDAGPPSGGVLI